MKIFILVVGLLELLVGSVLLINPRLMAAYKKANNALLTTARMYGAAACSIGVFAVYVFSNYENIGISQLPGFQPTSVSAIY